MSLDSMGQDKFFKREKELLTCSKGLNSTLTRFYLEFGRTFNPDAWLERNPYHDAFSDDEEEWMNY